MPYLRTILATSLLMLLLLNCGGREAAPQPAAAPPDSTIPEPQLQSLEEKYPGYKFRHLYLEYEYAVDSTAPVIYSRLDTVIDGDHEVVWFYHNDWRESISTLDSLPENIQDFMSENEIVVPGFRIKPGALFFEYLFLKGQFNDDSIPDWAVVCSKGGYCWITVFWNGETLDTSIVNYRAFDESVNKRGGGSKLMHVYNDDSYSDSYQTWGYFDLLEISFDFYYWPQSPARPDSFSHSGLAESDAKSHGNFYYYFDNGRLLTWGDAMPGWQEWHEMNQVTMQDSLLLDPLLANELPPQLALEWHDKGIKLARLGDNPWCITGEFIRKGQTDCIVWKFDNSQTASYEKITLVLFQGNGIKPPQIVYSVYDIETFKRMRYKNIPPQQVEKMYHEAESIVGGWLDDMREDYVTATLNPPFEREGFFIEEQNPYNKDDKTVGVLYFQEEIEWRIFIQSITENNYNL